MVHQANHFVLYNAPFETIQAKAPSSPQNKGSVPAQLCVYKDLFSHQCIAAGEQILPKWKVPLCSLIFKLPGLFYRI